MTEETGGLDADRPASSETPDFSVRQLHEGDWRSFRDVRLAALQDCPISFAPTLEQEVAYEEEQWRDVMRAGAVFVAEAADRTVGVAAGISREPPGLGAMWVSPRWRGTGVGAELVAGVLEWARTGGHDQVTLWAPADDARACRFYERQGFSATGVTKSLPGSDTRRVQEMARPTG